MKKIISYCGFVCSDCPVYKDNVKSENDRKNVVDNWKKLFNIDISEEEVYCDGCRKSDEENPVRLVKYCRNRICAKKHFINNCAMCNIYPCSDLTRQMKDFEHLERMYKYQLSKEIYKKYIKPYKNREILNKIKCYTDKP